MRKTYEFDGKLKSRLPDDVLAHNPIVVRVNKFDEEAAKAFNMDFSHAHTVGQEVIPVLIDSYGGQCYSLSSMVSEMQQSRVPVATVTESKAMSCGAILFGMGTVGHRFVGPHATIMIHEVSSMAWGKVEELKADVKETSRLNDKFYQMLSLHCGKDEDYFHKMMHKKSHADWFLTPKQAIKHGLADHIGIPEFRVKVSVTARLEL